MTDVLPVGASWNQNMNNPLSRANIRLCSPMEMWLWRRVKRINWTEKRNDDSIPYELGIKHELLGHVRKRKLSYYGPLCGDHGSQITKTVVDG